VVEFKNVILIVASVLISVSCATQPSVEQEKAFENEAGVYMLFSETEPGVNPYQVTIFVNSRFMHIKDNTAKDNDFILFDRNKKTIYNVVAEGKTILVIGPQNVNVDPPIKINYTEEKEESSALVKRTGGKTALHYHYLANNKSCYDVVVVEDYLPDVVRAFQEFRQVLAGEHAKTIDAIPSDMLDPCDLAINIFEPTRHLQHGFPVREWDEKGYQRFLVDVRENVVPPEGMMSLPTDYTKYSIQE
jgi:hypothetical protein